MSFSLVLNSNNVVGSNNNTFQYKFVNGSFKIPENSEMCISSITIPYSFYNVSSYYNNQVFQFTFPNTASTTYTITLPAGFYSAVDISNYIQQFCITNNLYLIDSNSNYVYYINLSYNSNYYSVQLLLFAVPTSLPSGYTAPSGWAGYPAVATTPTFTVLSTNTFGTLIGYNAGSYGPSSSSLSFLSNKTPVGSNIQSLIVRCNIVDNSVINPTDILDSIPIQNTSFGSNIVFQPSYERWIKVKSGNYSSLNITFTDQSFNPIYALDSNVCITLMIKFGDSKK